MKRFLVILVLACLPTWAAINAVTQWEVRNGGNDTNGGGFAYGLGNKEHAAMADLTIDATNNKVVTSATHNFVAGDAGKYINVTAGTGWRVGWYRIASASANAATLDWSPSAAGNANVGTGDFYYGIDYPSLNDAKNTATANISTTDAAVTNSATLTSANANFTESIAGNSIYLVIGGGSCNSGTVSAQWRQVIAYVDEATVTLDATPSGSPDTCTGVTMNIGGAFASIGSAGLAHVASNTIWLKYHATAFSPSSTTSNIAAGRLTLAAGPGREFPTSLRGYETTRGDETAKRPTIAWGVNALFTSLVTAGNYGVVENIIFDGMNGTYTNTAAIVCTTGVKLRRIKVHKFNNTGVNVGTANVYISDSEFTNNVVTSITVTSGITTIVNSYFHDTAGNGIDATAGTVNVLGCIFDTIKSGASYSAVAIISSGTLMMYGSTVYNSGTHGVSLASGAAAYVFNSHFEANGGSGISLAAEVGMGMLQNSSGYGNAADYTSQYLKPWDVSGFVPVTAGSAFVDGPNANFAPNNTTSQGNLIRGFAVPVTVPATSSTSYRDIGAVQHQEAARVSAYAQ